jgi:hypothetical protein
MPGFRIVNSSASLDRNVTHFPCTVKPDVSIYRANSDPGVLTDSSLAEIFVEFKWDYPDDPFCDVYMVKLDPTSEETVKSFFRNTKTSDDVLGQITTYAAVQLGSQFRTHIYSVLIVKDTARIFRWDRSGAIVTEAIHYDKSPLLVDFFRRYSKAPPDMRGVDQSVSDPTLEEARAARQALELRANEPVFKLAVPVQGGAPRFFITSAPRAAFYTPPGRATRGFHAYDISQATLGFLKDTWRVDMRQILPEGETYKLLSEARVCNIAGCIASGDILTTAYHATKTASYTSAEWACFTEAHFVPHRHYRLVLDVIGRSLLAFRSSYEMVAAVRDAVLGRLDYSIMDEQR